MFSIHGDWKIEVCGNVLVQSFSGCWNEEAIISYVKEFRAKAAPLVAKEWAILSIFEEWELGIPAINKHIEDHCNWFKANGCIKDCHIYTHNPPKKMLLERLIPQTDDYYERQVFTNTKEAVAWLASHKFIIENSNIINNSDN